MEYLTIFVAVASVTGTLAAPAENIPEKIKRIMDECAEEVHIGSNTIVVPELYTKENQPKVAELMYCCYQKLGFFNREGELKNDVIKPYFARHEFVKPEQVEAILEKCSVKKHTPQETAYWSQRCFRNEVLAICIANNCDKKDQI